MKKSFLLCLIIPFGFGCTSSYKNMQTPDDVYYSPGFYKLRSSDSSRSNSDASRESSTVINNRPTYHRDYDEDYYYNRRRVYYYDNDYYPSYKTSRKVAAPRTVNLGGYSDKKPEVVEYSKIRTKNSNPVVETEKSGKPVRTFKKSNTFIGNAVKAIIGGTQYNSTNNTNSSPSTNSSTKNNSSSATPPAKSATAPVRSFEKKN